MQGKALPNTRSIALAALSLFMGGIVSAAGILGLSGTPFPWWAELVLLLGCIGTAEVLARFRSRGYLPQSYIPVIVAAAGLGIIAKSFKFDVIGTLFVTIAGIDLVKRGWDAPVSTQAVWSRIKTLSLFFSISTVFLGIRAMLASLDEYGTMSASSGEPLPNALPPSASTGSDLARESRELFVDVDTSEAVLRLNSASHLSEALDRCDWLFQVYKEDNLDRLSTTLHSRGEAMVVGLSPSRANYRCRIGRSTTGDFIVMLTKLSGPSPTDSKRDDAFGEP
jgi:hypothetical protein